MDMKNNQEGRHLPMDIYQLIQELVDKGINKQLIEREDEVYVRNQILSFLHLNSFTQKESLSALREIPDILEEILHYACQEQLIENTLDEREILSSAIMNCFLSKPSTINHTFYQKYKENPVEATDYFYKLSKDSNYIQTKQISKNSSYKVDTEYGEIDITINLSKPEKDPKQIAKEKAAPSLDVNYPRCLLCQENEGYKGRTGHPARANHRMIRVNLLEEQWLLQYSPYVYYNEHCILLSSVHRDMKINKDTFSKLLMFVEKFPHYFIGSNADLPIVGGSILTHDHYQGGRYEFAMTKATDDFLFKIDNFPNVDCSILHWPMSVIRLKSKNAEEIVNLSDHILQTWKKYSDRTVDIIASSNGEEHNTVTPIARKKNGIYELDLVLRNNRTDDDYPMGIFHPHHDVHHIKKENIGLIEVMGLAVLPARLKEELIQIENFLLGRSHQIADYHKEWAQELKTNYKSQLNISNIKDLLEREVGKKFLRCLEDAGVFKRNKVGQQAFRKFLELL